uniref:Ubiquitin-like domain-containing protein n=1 Tax=Plectus sambesii TaxID=2011161 RepID=A0A914WQW9_9BILA
MSRFDEKAELPPVMVCLTVETVTGQQLLISVFSTDTVLSLKRRIWERTGIPPYHQGLIYAGHALSCDETRISALGCESGAYLKLVLLARSGPVVVNRTTPVSIAEPESSTDASCSNATVEDDCQLDWTFTEERRLESRAKADENRRTLAKMREIRRNINEIKASKHPTSLCEEASTSSAGAPLTTPMRSSSSSRHFLSAPEDTSAKESSAGETEYEEWRPSCPVPLRDFVHHRQQRLNAAAKQHDNASWVKPQKPHRPPQTRTTSLSACRVPSSSSEPESAGAVWTTTGDEEEDEVQLSADEDVVDRRLLLDQEVLSGAECSPVCSPIATKGAPARVVSPVEHPSDPSDLSSGMIICDLSNEFRRLKVRRKHHAPASGRGRTRSKPRPVGFGAPGVFHLPDVRSSTEISSSEDERKKNKPIPLCTLPFAMINARKNVGGFRPAKKTLPDQTVGSIRMHKQPQSSQSQQRCNACGYKLSMSATFQCRCGKSLCSRHRPPELHMCTKLHRTSAKLQDVSD